jgi:hypothetical protein
MSRVDPMSGAPLANSGSSAGDPHLTSKRDACKAVAKLIALAAGQASACGVAACGRH